MTKKNSSTKRKILNKPAVVAGLSLLGMAVLAPIAHFGILPSIVALDDAVKTNQNIAADLPLFILAMACLVVVAVLDVIVAVSLYKFFKQADKVVNRYAALARILYAGVFLFAISMLGVAASLAHSDASAMVSVEVINSIVTFNAIWDLGLFIFGIHLILLGWLFWKTKYTPIWLAPLLIIAGLGYAIDTIGKFMIPGYSIEISTIAFIGEVVLIFWLLIKGRVVPQKASRKA